LTYNLRKILKEIYKKIQNASEAGKRTLIAYDGRLYDMNVSYLKNDIETHLGVIRAEYPNTYKRIEDDSPHETMQKALKLGFIRANFWGQHEAQLEFDFLTEKAKMTLYKLLKEKNIHQIVLDEKGRSYSMYIDDFIEKYL